MASYPEKVDRAYKVLRSNGFFAEQYTVTDKAGKDYTIFVPVRHGEHEKDNHALAEYLALLLFPEIEITAVTYC